VRRAPARLERRPWMGCRRLGEKTVWRKTYGRIIFWATDDWATTVISENTFRRKTDGRQRPKQFAFMLAL